MGRPFGECRWTSCRGAAIEGDPRRKLVNKTALTEFLGFRQHLDSGRRGEFDPARFHPAIPTGIHLYRGGGTARAETGVAKGEGGRLPLSSEHRAVPCTRTFCSPSAPTRSPRKAASVIQPLALKALMIQHASCGECEQREVGWSRVPHIIEDLVTCPEGLVHFLYQGELEADRF